MAKDTDLFNSIKLIWNNKTEEETPPQPQLDPTQPAAANPTTTPPNPEAVEDKKEEEIEETKSKKGRASSKTEARDTDNESINNTNRSGISTASDDDIKDLDELIGDDDYRNLDDPLSEEDTKEVQ